MNICYPNNSNSFETILIRFLSKANSVFVIVLSVFKAIRLPKFELVYWLANPLKLSLTRFLNRRINNYLEQMVFFDQELKLKIDSITPEDAKRVLDLHKKYKLNFISLYTKLSDINFMDNEELAIKYKKCLDLIFDGEYIIRKRVNSDKTRNPSELSKIVAQNSIKTVRQSL